MHHRQPLPGEKADGARIVNVTGSRILVVGGVRRLGRRIALDLATHGASICVSSRSSGPSADAAVAALSATGAPTARAIVADVRRSTDATAAVHKAAAVLGGLDGLVYAASGPFVPQAPHKIDEASWDESLDTIAKGFFFAACAAREVFTRANTGDDARPPTPGVIVAITDGLGVQPWSNFAAHGAAKAAQIHLVKELARAWAADGVRVCGVLPGPVDLDDDEHRDATLRAAAKAPLPRLVAAADVGRAVRFCLETDAATGVNVIVDNGLLLTC